VAVFIIKSKTGKFRELENNAITRPYFNTPFYGCRKLTFWLKDLGFKGIKR
jgi:hypothetical protein